MHLPCRRRGRSGGVAAASRLCGGGGPCPRGVARGRPVLRARRWRPRFSAGGVGKAVAALPGLRRSPARPPPPFSSLQLLCRFAPFPLCEAGLAVRHPPHTHTPPPRPPGSGPAPRGGLFWGYPWVFVGSGGSNCALSL